MICYTVFPLFVEVMAKINPVWQFYTEKKRANLYRN